MSAESDVFFDRSAVFDTTQVFDGTVIASYPEKGSPLVSGYLPGERRLQGKAAGVDGRHGDGHVVVLGFRPQWRGQPWGSFRVLAGLLAALTVACGKPGPSGPDLPLEPADAPVVPARGFFMGVLPTPAAGQTFAEVHRAAADFTDFVPVHGRPTPFWDMAGELRGSWGRTFVEQYVRGNKMFPLVHMSFLGADLTLAVPPGMSGATLSTPAWREAYKRAALDMIRAARPAYISLGNEVNRWYERYGAGPADPNGFQHFVTLYHDIYGAAKALSPRTKVFVTFAREIVAENREADMRVLEMFDPAKLDLLVLTSYPYAVRTINKPADIPADYYSRVLARMPGKRLGFSELGWAALAPFGGEAGQAAFIQDASHRLTRDRGVALELFGWCWLNALDATDAVALANRDGTARQGLMAWRALAASRAP